MAKNSKAVKKSKAVGKSKPIIVTVADAKLKNIQQVADQLTAEGMQVRRVLPITGVISGLYTSVNLSDLEKVDGVMSVEEEVSAQLPPADSTLQ
ncbi:MAG: hypothetical protein M3O61_08100 [Gemmatimonadota bacterium]|nr:hypothetical protein [Gemmatimonadota bacterium]